MYRTRSKGIIPHGERARSTAEFQQQIQPATSKNATQKSRKTGYVVLKRIDMDSLNNSLAGLADTNLAGRESDKPDAKKSKKVQKPVREGKENVETVDPPVVQAKATRRAAKGKKVEAAGTSQAKEDNDAPQTARSTTVHGLLEDPKASLRKKEVVFAPTTRATRSKTVDARPAPAQTASKTKDAGETRAARVARSKTIDARPSAPRAGSKIKADVEKTTSRGSRSKSVEPTAAASRAVSRVRKPDSRSVNSGQSHKDSPEIAKPVVQLAKRENPRRGCRPPKQEKVEKQPMPMVSKPKGKKQNQKAAEPVIIAEKPVSKPANDATLATKKTTASSKTSGDQVNKPVKMKPQATVSQETLSNELKTSSEAMTKLIQDSSPMFQPLVNVEPVKLPARRGRRPDKSVEVATKSVKNRSVPDSPADTAVHEAKSATPAVSYKTVNSPKSPPKGNPESVPDDDPYSFNLSQSEARVEKPKNAVKPRKRAAKPKPGNKIELLMQKKKLEAVGSSCNVQQNPVRYEAERTQLQKQLDVSIPTTSKFNVDSQPARHAVVAHHSQHSSIATTSQATLQTTTVVQKHMPSTNFFVGLKARPSAKKVVHSPKAAPPPEIESPQPFVSDSPPIRSQYAMQMARIAKRQTAKSSPFRVDSRLPSTFYMSLSSNDCTPSFSSDPVDKRAEPCGTMTSSGDASKVPETGESILAVPMRNDTSRPLSLADTVAAVPRKSQSILEDSNAENIAPENAPKRVKKIHQGGQLRSPLKALAISTLAQDLSTITLKKKVVQKEASKLASENVSGSLNFDSAYLERDQESRDAFGFDELLGNDTQSQAGPSGGPSTSREDYRTKVENIKQYLPSKNNKSRDKDIFPTSPVKHIRLLHSPSKKSVTSLRQFMTASTPVLGAPKLSTPFGDTSGISEGKEGGEETFDEDASGVQLFDEQQEIAPAQRSYSRPKRLPAFLQTVEDSDSDDEDDGAEARKAPTRSKRNKFNIEETGEFKKFVHDKSTEFAEVDDYQMVIE